MLFLVLFAYPIALETLWRGRTLGKMALGLRVVTVEGGPVRFRHAAIRAVLALVEVLGLFGSIAILSVLMTRRNQRLGDLAAGTLVLRERTGLRAPVPVAFGVPPGMDAYVDSLDTAAMTAEDYAAVRAFLMRAPSLPWAVRRDLAQRLAHTLGARLRPEPPPGLHPEAYLACLAAAVQRRDAPVMPNAPATVSAAATVSAVATEPVPGPVAPPAPPQGGFAPPG
jgi:hypothetical protein